MKRSVPIWAEGFDISTSGEQQLHTRRIAVVAYVVERSHTRPPSLLGHFHPLSHFDQALRIICLAHGVSRSQSGSEHAGRG